MTLVAASAISDGTNTIDEGTAVPKGAFDDDTIEHLKEIGAIVEPDVISALEADEKDKLISDLQAQLKALQDEKKDVKVEGEAPKPAPAKTAASSNK